MTSTDLALTKLRNMLESDGFGPGVKLPPERELAPTLGVGRSTLRKALSLLEAEGRILRGVGQGTFVGRLEETRNSLLLSMDPLPSPSDLLETRLLLEPQIASAAALRAHQPDIALLRDMVEKGARVTDSRSWDRWDGAFHRMFAEASRNPLLVSLIDAMTRLRNHDTWGRLRHETLTADAQALFSNQHRAIVDAVADRDSRLAAKRMREHVETVMDRMTGSHTAYTDGTAVMAHSTIDEENSRAV